MQHAAYFDGAVTASAQQVKRGNAGQGTYFVYNDGSPIQEKGLNGIQCGRGQRLEESQAEALRNRRVNSVEDSIGAGALYPDGPAIGIQATARFSELQAGVALGTLQAPRKIEIGKYHRRVNLHRENLLHNAGPVSTAEHRFAISNMSGAADDTP